jgi:hypothetical protein
VTAAAGLAARLKRAVAFVAIVWAVSATFIAFQAIALIGTGIALGNPDLLGDLFLPPVISRSTICAEQPAGAVAPRNPAALADAWSLGLAFGREAILRQQEIFTNPQALAELRADVEQSADKIGVPPPETFVPRQIANAHREFVAFLEGDSRQTARALAKGDSSRACHLYKLGAAWSYSEVALLILPNERNVLALEIHHYARQAGLPDELWRPMIEPQPSVSRAEVLARTQALTLNMTRHLAESR